MAEEHESHVDSLLSAAMNTFSIGVDTLKSKLNKMDEASQEQSAELTQTMTAALETSLSALALWRSQVALFLLLMF